jgi:NADH dehydrogenase FAD-containing subunit
MEGQYDWQDDLPEIEGSKENNPFLPSSITNLKARTALVGKHAGVAKIYGQHFSGFLAWAMWRAIYLSKMPGMGQRARILLDWILDFVFGRNIAEFPVDRSNL